MTFVHLPGENQGYSQSSAFHLRGQEVIIACLNKMHSTAYDGEHKPCFY